MSSSLARDGGSGGATPALVLLLVLFALRLTLSALIPLVPDEAYYALWSTRLQAGYLDHPPMIAWMIRPGVMLFGETPLGVRFVPMLSAIPASWFVWRSASLLVADRRAGPLAAVLFNVTLIGFFGMAVATPDAPLIFFCAAILFCAAHLVADPRPAWWIAAGVATGLAMQSKYSAALYAAGFSLAVLLLPEWRRRLAGPWPWLAFAVAVLVFAPNLAWNAAHDWATVLKQGSRATEDWQFSPHFLAELIGAQIGLATPLVAIFAVLGLLPRFRPAYRSAEARWLLLALILVPTAYFVFHALRSRVEGNWPGFLYPALAVAAAAAMLSVSPASRTLDRLKRLTVPVALAMILLASIHTLFVPLTTLGRRDPILRLTRGWEDFAGQVDGLRRSVGAGYVLAGDYPLNAELALWLPDVAVAQYNERERYRFLADPSLDGLSGAGLLVSHDPIDPAEWGALGITASVGPIQRRYRDVVISEVFAYRVERPAIVR